VLQGRGCLNFSLVLRYDRAAGLDDVAQSFRHVLERIRSRIASVAAVAVVRCAQDLVIDGRKFNGNAQRRLRSHFLHQGSILYEFDLALIARYLKEPQRQPAYRAGRDHLSFLTNLNCDGLLLRDCLRSAWDADALAADWPQELMQRLTEERYSQPSWTYRL
jgi:lipoate-protein ligase A